MTIGDYRLTERKFRVSRLEYEQGNVIRWDMEGVNVRGAVLELCGLRRKETIEKWRRCSWDDLPARIRRLLKRSGVLPD